MKTDTAYIIEAHPVIQAPSPELVTCSQPQRKPLAGQLLRFALVGGVNTLVDLLVLNGLLWLFPTINIGVLLVYNVLAYTLGALNSFLLNKYWTFGSKQETTRQELARFSLTTLCGIGWSTSIIWLTSSTLHPLLVNPTIWANASKGFAIAGTSLISYLGMRLWVFVNKKSEEPEQVQNISHTIDRQPGTPLARG